jgi:hypothetical protein
MESIQSIENIDELKRLKRNETARKYYYKKLESDSNFREYTNNRIKNLAKLKRQIQRESNPKPLGRPKKIKTPIIEELKKPRGRPRLYI